MAADFSNLSATTAAMVSAYVRSGRIPTDEMLIEAAERIVPTLLPRALMRDLRTELDPTAQRRGRPAKGLPRPRRLLLALEGLQRSDVPEAYLDALATRLETDRRFREFHRASKLQRQLNKRHRDELIRWLYHDLHSRIGSSSTGLVSHSILGDLKIPDEPTPSDRAREMTRTILHHLFGNSPSVSTIRNIAVRRKFKA